MPKISVVINTSNEEKNIERTIKNVGFADEVIICDMYSSDKTVEIAKKNGAKVVFRKNPGFVEPARNFAISKAVNDWVLILDADEKVQPALVEKIKQISQKEKSYDFVKIPRKNIIFKHWMKAALWWPDYQVRFFKKGAVVWQDKIHNQPQTKGEGLTLPEEERYAILHNNYQTVTQFIERMNRYTTIEAEQLQKGGYQFAWKDLIEKPLSEFLSRFFANKGYEDGLHGLALALLQAFSFFVVYLKTWENKGFKEGDIDLPELKTETDRSGAAINYWFKNIMLSKNPFSRILKVFKFK